MCKQYESPLYKGIPGDYIVWQINIHHIHIVVNFNRKKSRHKTASNLHHKKNQE